LLRHAHYYARDTPQRAIHADARFSIAPLIRDTLLLTPFSPFS